MTTTDLSTLNDEELAAMTVNIQKAMAVRLDARLRAEIDALKAYGRSQGFLVDEIFPEREAALLPKYRHPDTPEMTWSGRGRRPDWLNAEISKGRRLEDFRIS